jgi:hypothetical protein
MKYAPYTGSSTERHGNPEKLIWLQISRSLPSRRNMPEGLILEADGDYVTLENASGLKKFLYCKFNFQKRVLCSIKLTKQQCYRLILIAKMFYYCS